METSLGDHHSEVLIIIADRVVSLLSNASEGWNAPFLLVVDRLIEIHVLEGFLAVGADSEIDGK